MSDSAELQMKRLKRRCGQAIAELTVALVIFIILFVSVVTFRNICLQSESLRRDVRCEAGIKSFDKVPIGWSPGDDISQVETRTHILHKINAKNHFEELRSSLPSHVSTSAYTLSQRTFVLQEFGLSEVTKKEKEVPLDRSFIQLIYGKDAIHLSERLSFPGVSNLY